MRRLLIVFLTALAPLSLDARDLNKLYEKVQLKIGDKNISAYIADTDRLRADGLMFIKSLPADTGMLFIFERKERLSFWMKNTLIPLSIGFFDEKGLLVDVQEMKVAPSLIAMEVPSYRSRAPAKLALEMKAGWYSENGIRLGARLRLLSPAKSSLLKSSLKPASAGQ